MFTLQQSKINKIINIILALLVIIGYTVFFIHKLLNKEYYTCIVSIIILVTMVSYLINIINAKIEVEYDRIKVYKRFKCEEININRISHYKIAYDTSGIFELKRKYDLDDEPYVILYNTNNKILFRYNLTIENGEKFLEHLSKYGIRGTQYENKVKEDK